LADWHPLLNAIEVAAGEWWMPDPTDEPYAVVRLVEVNGERGYRVVTYAPESADRQLIGYYGNLRAAARGANMWFVQSRGWNGTPFIGWKGAQQR
jgi:hypothetical protein